MSRIRILCLGDLHLGLRPSRLPPDIDPREHATSVAWSRAVNAALERDVGLVLLSGDVVDRANRYFEGYGRLRDGLDRLADAGIAVCAVAGNHDAETLDRLHSVLPGGSLRLLGAGGCWERFTLQDESGSAVLHVDGWSFPERDVVDDPAEDYDLSRPDDGAPVLGLVHGDLDRPGSTNAPLARSGLVRLPVDAWVLGHIHKPDRIDLAAGRWALYPGSPQPLDPTETGIHGAWEIEIEDGTVGVPSRLALATIRYERIPVDLRGTETEEDVRAAIVRQVSDGVAGLDLEGDPEWVVLQVELTGKTGAHGHLNGLARRLESDDPLEIRAGAGRARVVEVLVRTRPRIDLRERAGADDPVGLLAELLLALEPEGIADVEREVDPELLRAVRAREREASEYAPFARLEADASSERRGDPDEDADADDRTRRRLARVAASLLDALLDTKEARRGEEAVEDRP